MSTLKGGLKYTFPKLVIPILIFTLINCLFFYYSKPSLKQRSHFIYKREQKTDSRRLFCMIITAPQYLNDRALAVHDTWARDCDKYVFISQIPNDLKTNQNSNTNETQEIFQPLPILQPAGLIKDDYEKLTAKMYATMKDVYKRYNDYQWYLKADDDSLFFIDHLYKFLENKNSSLPQYYGHVLQPFKRRYNSGGAGYVLSNEALRLLTTRIQDTQRRPCSISRYEDYDLAKCLASVGVYPKDAADKYGRERFHLVDPKTCFEGSYPLWFSEYSTSTIRKGFNCCSNETISFHYLNPEPLREMYNIYQEHKTSSKPFNFTALLEELLLV